MYSAVFFLLLVAPVFGETWQEYLDAQKDFYNIEHGVVLAHDDGSIRVVTFGSPISKLEALAGAKSFGIPSKELEQTGLVYGRVHYAIYEVAGDHMYRTGVGESLMQDYILAVACVGPLEKCQPRVEEIADWLRDNIDGPQE